MVVRGDLMEDLYWWQACYIEALLETDQNFKVARIYEAIAALEQRLLSPIEPGSDEDIKIKAAQAGLTRLRSEMCDGLMSQPTAITDA
jgi:hypothetical protein